MTKKTARKSIPEKISKEAMAREIGKKDIGKLLGQWAREFAVFVPSASKKTRGATVWSFLLQMGKRSLSLVFAPVMLTPWLYWI